MTSISLLRRVSAVDPPIPSVATMSSVDAVDLPDSLASAAAELKAKHRATWLVVSNRGGTEFSERATRKYLKQLTTRRRGPTSRAPDTGETKAADDDDFLTVVQRLVMACRKRARQKAASGTATGLKARRRWTLLRSALRKGGSEEAGEVEGASSVSVRRHAGFNLLPKSQVAAHVVVPSPASWEVADGAADTESHLHRLCTQIAAVAAHGSMETWLWVDVVGCDSRARLQEAATQLSEALAIAVARAVKVEVYDARTLLVSIAPARRAVSSTHSDHAGTSGSGEAAIFESYELATLRGTADDITHVPRVYVRRRRPGSVSITDLASHHDNDGVDNTGNVCVWPAEEVLAHLCLRERRFLAGKHIVELGAGMTGLAGLAAAVGVQPAPASVTITDGNKAAVENLRRCVALNPGTPAMPAASTRCRHLVWDRNAQRPDELAPADVVMAADCLFFADFHVDLVHTLAELVGAPRDAEAAAATGGSASHPADSDAGAGGNAGAGSGAAAGEGGVATIPLRADKLADLGLPQVWLVAPRRGTTLARFVELASARFRVHMSEAYDAAVSKRHEEFQASLGGSGAYDADIHYPVLLVLTLR